MQARPHARTYTPTYTRTHARLLPEIFQAQNVSTFLLLVNILPIFTIGQRKKARAFTAQQKASRAARGVGVWITHSLALNACEGSSSKYSESCPRMPGKRLSVLLMSAWRFCKSDIAIFFDKWRLYTINATRVNLFPKTSLGVTLYENK